MRHSQTIAPKAIAGIVFLAGLITGCPATTPTINVDSQPTAEGLYEVTGIDADEALARPDSEPGQYSKILLEDIDIEFRPGGEAGWSPNVSRSGGPYEVTEELAAEYRAIAEREITEEFDENGGFTLVNQPGSGVLSVTVKLEDVVSYIPPEQIGQRSAYLGELGEATLVMELRDSTTDTVVARSIDRHTAENLDNQIRASLAITNTAEIERMFRLFGRQMRRQLEDFAAIGE